MEQSFRDLLETFEKKRPEIIFEWQDHETEAEGWVVINSLRGGAAGGGTRMRKGLDKNEVVSLAKTMEVKFTVSGPAIGGAKSGINFDPNDPRKKEVLQRWYAAVKPLLKEYYGTGGDLNVDEKNDVIPITEDEGIWHPQEGVFKGHFKPSEAQLINRIGQLRQGVIKVIEDKKYTPDLTKKYTVADMITGWGVAEAVKHYYGIWGGKCDEKRVVIQGWGNVGAAAGFYLASMGAKIIAISDFTGGIIRNEGFSTQEVNDFFIKRKNNILPVEEKLSHEDYASQLRELQYEIFIPAAASRLINRSHVMDMIKAKVEVISSGANVPFDDPEIFIGSTGLYADEKISVLPDFIANCGMARVFAHLMEEELELTDENIFNDVSDRIRIALENVHQINPEKEKIVRSALKLALSQLV